MHTVMRKFGHFLETNLIDINRDYFFSTVYPTTTTFILIFC